MKEAYVNFGTVKIPVDEQHEQTGILTSVEWSAIRSKIEIRLYSPSHGDPLLEEVESKNYSFESE